MRSPPSHDHGVAASAGGAAPVSPPAADRPDLSVVVVNRNTRRLLEDCLASIERIPEHLHVETIVVDNGSTDGSPEMVRERFPSVRLIANPDNTGYAYPNNQGIAASRGRHVLLLNSDTVVKPHALGRLVAFMDAHPRAGACGPTLRFPDGQVQPSCFSVPSPRTYFSCVLTLDRRFPRSRLFGTYETGFDHAHTAPVEALLGAALLVRREVLDEVGGLDERFRIHYNDFDWCRRIRDAGWEVWYVHDAEIVHYSAVTTRNENRALRLQGELVGNLFEYHRKHYGRAGVAWVRFWMAVGWGARYLAEVVRPGASDESRRVLRRGMVRAALTGDPDQFTD